MVMNFCCAAAGAAGSAAASAAAQRPARMRTNRFVMGCVLWVDGWTVIKRSARLGERRIDGACEPLDDLVELGVGDDERRRQQHMVAAAGRRWCRPSDNTIRPRAIASRLDARVQLAAPDRTAPWWRGRRTSSMRPEQAAAADVAHVRVGAEAPRAGARARPSPLARTRVEQAVALDHLLHRQRRGAGHRVAEVGVAVLEEAAASRDRVDDARLRQHRADRLVAAAQALGDGHQVGHHAFLLAGVQRAGAAHAAHHLVEDQQHAVAVADLAHAA